jgi:hypothetical protein
LISQAESIKYRPGSLKDAHNVPEMERRAMLLSGLELDGKSTNVLADLGMPFTFWGKSTKQELRPRGHWTEVKCL